MYGEVKVQNVQNVWFSKLKERTVPYWFHNTKWNQQLLNFSLQLSEKLKKSIQKKKKNSSSYILNYYTILNIMVVTLSDWQYTCLLWSVSLKLEADNKFTYLQSLITWIFLLLNSLKANFWLFGIVFKRWVTVVVGTMFWQIKRAVRVWIKTKVARPQRTLLPVFVTLCLRRCVYEWLLD